MGVVTVPEEVGQFTVGEFFRDEFDLNRFGMIPQIVICRVFFGSSRVSDTGPRDAFNDPEPGIRSPESAECESGYFRLRFRRIALRKYHGCE